MTTMETMETMDILDAHSRLSRQHHQTCQLGKILSAGGMMGTALLFPIAHADGLSFRALNLTIFTLSLVVFHALHLEPFIRFGPYTAPAALFILLVFVLPGASPNQRDIIPWLPLYVVAACLFTALLYELPYRITSRGPDVTQVVYDDSNFPLPFTSHRGPRSLSDWSEPRAPSQSYRNDQGNFLHMGPESSSRSVQTGSGGTEYTLSHLDGATRDPNLAADIYGNSHFQDHPSTATPGADAYEAAPYMEHGQVRHSRDSTMDSRAPLLPSFD